MTEPLSDDDHRRLLTAARQAIADALAGAPEAALAPDGVFARHAGIFVSLHKRGNLRGCIGYTDADRPLGATVGRCAVAAATGDPRFDPVTERELAELDIEISVLSPLERVDDPATVVVGRDGLMIEQDRHCGLLLPQVATEHGWTRETFLGQTCVKAGLPRDAWKRGAALFRFQADVFGERSGRA